MIEVVINQIVLYFKKHAGHIDPASGVVMDSETELIYIFSNAGISERLPLEIPADGGYTTDQKKAIFGKLTRKPNAEKLLYESRLGKFEIDPNTGKYEIIEPPKPIEDADK